MKHQFEQIFNAYYLGKTGYGAYWKKLTKEKVESFLFNLPVYREALAKYPHKDNSVLFRKLDELIAEHTAKGRKAQRRIW